MSATVTLCPGERSPRRRHIGRSMARDDDGERCNRVELEQRTA